MFSLQELYGSKVKVTRDASYAAELPQNRNPKAWYDEIKGARGLIYPQSLDKNLICVQTTPRIGRKLLEVFKGLVEFKRRGDWEFEITAPVKLTQAMFKYIKPKFKRQLSEVQKKVLVERLLKARKSPQEPPFPALDSSNTPEKA